jgi:hypothetical protein
LTQGLTGKVHSVCVFFITYYKPKIFIYEKNY